MIKRKCGACKAIRYKHFDFPMCDLGHPIEISKKFDGLPIECKPLEECEKPLTYSDFCKISLNKNNNDEKKL